MKNRNENKSILLPPRQIILFLISVFVFTFSAYACASISVSNDNDQPKQNVNAKGNFVISSNGKTVPLYASSKDFQGVLRVLKLFQNDIKMVTDSEPVISLDEVPSAKEIIIVGTIGKSEVVDKLIEKKKLNVEEVADKWDSYLRQVIENPYPGVERALVIAGSNKRGTMYGMFDISKQIGVSPWYWWADVPVKKQNEIYVSSQKIIEGEPKVKYRGIFINDEAPAFSGWTNEKFGGFNSKMYVHVFELLLRLKANFLWPAMWGSAFYDDDPENPKLADEYGIVISTSHHEPMMRAHDEWRRYGKGGAWNYEKNKDGLQDFWRKGIERMGDYESVVTLAMRGDGDEAMSPDANVSLLQTIVEDQRKILADVTKKDVTTIPQVWALYKEVQEYYDKGMRVPDDVTLLLCDDNWGNVRKLPHLGDKPRAGGYGIYYHFDFVGGPRSYRWLNTTQIERVWEQMHLSYRYGADRIWVVNVGDLKPMELPISFFLDYAWDPEKIKAEDLPGYYRSWAGNKFGTKYADDIATILKGYTKFNSRRKPESIEPGTYSLTNYREAETVVADYKKLEEKAEKIYEEISDEYKDAFYQLVLHPVQACANLNEMYVAVAKNRLYAKQGRASANNFAEKVKQLFERDAEISEFYHKVIAGGKWNHMMSQPRIGYTSWNNPEKNIMPAVGNVDLPEKADMGVAVEGSDKWLPGESSEAFLPEFDSFNKQSYYIEIFNRGKNSFDYSIATSAGWLKVSAAKGKIDLQERIWVSIVWDKAPKGNHNAFLKINGNEGKEITVNVVINNYDNLKLTGENIFIESNGYASMEAENYFNAVNNDEVSWIKIPNLGRTASSMAPMPVTAKAQTPEGNSARLEYKVYLFNSGEVELKTYLCPTLNFGYTDGMRFAVSIDDEIPQIINMNEGENIPDWKYPGWWNNAVMNNIRTYTTKHNIDKPGEHIVKFWVVDPGIVLQKLVVETKECPPSYLGQPQSYNSVLVNKK